MGATVVQLVVYRLVETSEVIKNVECVVDGWGAGIAHRGDRGGEVVVVVVEGALVVMVVVEGAVVWCACAIVGGEVMFSVVVVVRVVAFIVVGGLVVAVCSGFRRPIVTASTTSSVCNPELTSTCP